MAREADRLVEAIRARRQRLAQDLTEIVSLAEVERRIRKEPLPWLLGGAVTGALLVRFILPSLLAHGRGAARSWIRGRLRSLVLALVLASTGRETRQRPIQPPPTTEEDRLAEELLGHGSRSEG